MKLRIARKIGKLASYQTGCVCVARFSHQTRCRATARLDTSWRRPFDREPNAISDGKRCDQICDDAINACNLGRTTNIPHWRNRYFGP